MICEIVAFSDGSQRFDIGGVAMQIDRQDGAGIGGDQRFYLIGIDGVVAGQDIRDHGPGATVSDGGGRGDIGIRYRDDFVAGADAAGAQGEEESDGAGADGDRVFRPHLGGKGRFEFRTHFCRVTVGVEDERFDGGHKFVAERVMGFECARPRDTESPGICVKSTFVGGPRRVCPWVLMARRGRGYWDRGNRAANRPGRRRQGR